MVLMLKLALALLPSQAHDAAIPAVEHADIDAWRQSIRPSGAELAFESIPWLLTFEDGLRASADQGKPLLLWLMNGHPLGCT